MDEIKPVGDRIPDPSTTEYEVLMKYGRWKQLWDTPRSLCSVLSSELQVPALGGHHNSVILGRDWFDFGSSDKYTKRKEDIS